MIIIRLGAYSGNKTYTENDITLLVEYAKLRGIRILMEIDSPAHASKFILTQKYVYKMFILI